MVDSALDKAMTALQTRNIALAQEVIANDEHVNALRFDIEKECLRVLATQQPAARDLRLVVATTHIAGELERIGDHACSIARVIGLLEVEQPISTLHKLPKMAKRARTMVESSINAFLSQDAEQAYALAKREDKLDRNYDELFHEMLLEMRDDEYIERANYLLWIGRHLERVGDRSTNIAERVIFMLTGEFVEIA
jgi:phosphate transport system protein